MRLRFRPLPWLTLASLVSLALLIALGQWQWTRYQTKLTRAPPARESLRLEAPEVIGAPIFVFGAWSGPGWRVFAPLRDGERVFFADVAYVRGSRPPAEFAPPSPQPGPVRIVRPPANRRPPPADPERRAFYALDLPAMAAAAGLQEVEPFYVAMPYRTDQGLAANPFADTVNAMPPERHLGYALTWWGLAAALVAVYFTFHAQTGRLSRH